MTYIIGDIGNTSTKICFFNSKFKKIKNINIETDKIYNREFKRKILISFLKKNINSKILFSSVVPLAFKRIKNYLKNSNLKLIEVKQLNLKKIIKINLKNYSQIGSDRIVNAIGVKNLKNCLVLDFGTATTFDIIRNSKYEGGVIAPGIKISIANLKNSTALLPSFKFKKVKKIYGKNTKEALNTGFFWGYEGLVNNIINKISSSGKVKYKIVLTGGYAKLFKNMIKKKTIVDQDITIKGLVKVYKELV